MDSGNNFDNFEGFAQELWKIWRSNFDKTTQSSGEFGAVTLKSYKTQSQSNRLIGGTRFPSTCLQ
jgi:hypothetical protein